MTSWGRDDEYFDGGFPDDDHPPQITSARTRESVKLEMQARIVKWVLWAVPLAFAVAFLAAIFWADNPSVGAVSTAVIALVSGLLGSVIGYYFAPESPASGDTVIVERPASRASRGRAQRASKR